MFSPVNLVCGATSYYKYMPLYVYGGGGVDHIRGWAEANINGVAGLIVIIKLL